MKVNFYDGETIRALRDGYANALSSKGKPDPKMPDIPPTLLYGFIFVAMIVCIFWFGDISVSDVASALQIRK